MRLDASLPRRVQADQSVRDTDNRPVRQTTYNEIVAPPNKTLLVRAGLVLLTLVLGVGAYALGTRLVNEGRFTGGQKGTPRVETVTFTDENAGIKLSYPQTWKQIENNSRIPLSEDEASEVRLIAGPEEDQPHLLVRVKPLPGEIDYDPNMSAQDLGIIQGQLDQLISPNVQVLSRKPINDKGKLGFHYLYVLKQESTGREGVHSHYFIFDGAKLNVLVFEVFPRARFEELAPTFDRILDSFNSERRRAPAGAATPGAAPPASPAPPAPAPPPSPAPVPS